MNIMNLKRLLVLFVSLSLFVGNSPLAATSPSVSYLAPVSITTTEPITNGLEDELDKVAQLMEILGGKKVRIKGREGRIYSLIIDQTKVLEAYDRSNRNHFPYLLAALGKKDSDLLYWTAVRLLQESELSAGEKREEIYSFARDFLGAAIYFSEPKNKEEMFDNVVSRLKQYEDTKLIPINVIEREAKKYSPAEYAAILGTIMIPKLGLGEYDGNLKRWNEKVIETSKLPGLVAQLRKTDSLTEKNELLNQILDEYKRLDVLYGEISRSGAIFPAQEDPLEKVGEDTVHYPVRKEYKSEEETTLIDEYTAVPVPWDDLQDFSTYLDELLAEVEEELFSKRNQIVERTISKYHPDKILGEIDQELKAKLDKRFEKIRESIERIKLESYILPQEGNFYLILSRTQLDTIGNLLLVLNKIGTLSGFGGKGTRFALRRYERFNGKVVRDPSDKAKGSYIMNSLGRKSILNLNLISHRDLLNSVLTQLLGEEFSEEYLGILLPEVIVESHITREDHRTTFREEMKLEEAFPPLLPLLRRGGGRCQIIKKCSLRVIPHSKTGDR